MASLTIRRLDEELELTAPLLGGEVVSEEGVVRSTTSRWSRRLSYLRVSRTRACLVAHYAFRPDVLIEIPRESIVSAVREPGAWVRIEARQEVGVARIRVRPWERGLRRLVVERVLRMMPDQLCELFR